MRASFRTLRKSAITDAALEALEREPGSSVAEIGYRLGFSSGSAFCRFMRRRAGASPTQLRKQQTANSKQQTANMRRRGARPGLITIGMRNGGGAAQH
jgi:AraC-like DNA-binding protein